MPLLSRIRPARLQYVTLSLKLKKKTAIEDKRKISCKESTIKDEIKNTVIMRETKADLIKNIANV